MGKTLTLTADEIKQAQGGNFEPLAEGVYGAVIYEAKDKVSRAGNEMYELNFKITDGPEGIGRKQMGWFVRSGKGLFKLIELNKATGFPYPTKDTKPGDFEFPDEDEYLGIKVNIELVQEPYESTEEDEDGNEVDVTKYRNNIKKVTKYDESKFGAAEAVDKKSGLFL